MPGPKEEGRKEGSLASSSLVMGHGLLPVSTYGHGEDSRAVIERCRYRQSATPPLPLAHACKVYDRLHAHVGIVILIVDYSS